MSINPRSISHEPRRQRAPYRTRRVAQRARNQRVKAFAGPGILDGVCDQHGGRWIRYGTRQHAIWFTLADLIGNASAVFSRLSSVGAPCITTASQTAFKRTLEAYGDYREALVASRPGWLEGFYVFGDGTMAVPKSDAREVIVAFAPSRKFAPQGSLKEWQDAVGSLVTGQPLPYFVLALALTGPLLRFAPPAYLNPQVEIVGGKETGKTTLGMLAASVWAGNPDSDCGGGVNWDTTLNALDDVKLARRDGFLFSDEGNLAGGGVGATAGSSQSRPSSKWLRLVESGAWAMPSMASTRASPCSARRTRRSPTSSAAGQRCRKRRSRG